jgi:hypothetical protein
VRLVPLLLLSLACTPDYWADADPVNDFGIEDDALVAGFERLRDWDLGAWPTATDLDPVLTEWRGDHVTARLYNRAADEIDRVVIDDALIDERAVIGLGAPGVVRLHPIMRNAAPENIPPLIAYVMGYHHWGTGEGFASPFGAQAIASGLAYDHCVRGHECVLWYAAEMEALDHIED